MLINLRAHGGTLDIVDTKIFSWDLGAEDYDHEPEVNGRRWNLVDEVWAVQKIGGGACKVQYYADVFVGGRTGGGWEAMGKQCVSY